jgi:acetoin utilization protein AcuC
VSQGGLAFLYEPALAEWRLSPDHPFKPERLTLVRDLLLASGLLSEAEIRSPGLLRPGELTAVHEPEYVAMVERISRGERPEEAIAFGLGTSDTPVADGLHEGVARVCAATATAVQLVADGTVRRAASFAGGLHHAMPGRASGFCIYDDLAVGIERATAAGLRVAYLDLDAHHGDGVQHAFYDRSDVLTISVHESGRYLFPGTGHTHEIGTGDGRGWSVNLPLEPFTEDDSYLRVFDEVVPGVLDAFGPDLIVLQAGADTHRDDPLAHLSLSLNGLRASYDRVVALADRHCDGRMVVTGGGGYAAYDVVPRAWAQAWSALSGRPMPEELPTSWRSDWQERLGVAMPRDALDEADVRPQPRRRRIESHNLAVARRLMHVLEGVWRERPSAQPDARSEASRAEHPAHEEATP